MDVFYIFLGIFANILILTNAVEKESRGSECCEDFYPPEDIVTFNTPYYGPPYPLSSTGSKTTKPHNAIFHSKSIEATKQAKPSSFRPSFLTKHFLTSESILEKKIKKIKKKKKKNKDVSTSTIIPQPKYPEKTTLVNLGLKVYTENKPLFLECSNGATNGDKLKWRINGKLLRKSMRVKLKGIELTIDPILPQDAGYLTCEININKKRTKWLIRVEALPKFILEPTFIKVKGEQSIMLNTSLNSGTYNSSVTVFVNGLFYEEVNASDVNLWVNSSMTLVLSVDLPGFVGIRSNEVFVEFVRTSGDCPESIGEGYTWGPKDNKEEEKAPCSSGLGMMKRKCKSNRKWTKVNTKGCKRVAIDNVKKKVHKLQSGTTGVDSDEMLTVSKEIKDLVDEDVGDEEDEMVNLIYRIAKTREYDDDDRGWGSDQNFTMETQNMMKSVGGMLKKFGKQKGNCNINCSLCLLASINVYSNIKSSQASLHVQTDRVFVFQRQLLKASAQSDIQRETPISLLQSFFKNRTAYQEHYITSSFFENLASFLPTETNDSYINSAMISLDVTNGRNEVVEVGDGEYFVEYTMQHLEHVDTKSTSSACVYWKSDGDLEGAWAIDGCKVVSSSVSHTVCQCNHLTNFVLLTSLNPNIPEGPLNIISLVGCVISLIALILTIAYYAVRWRKVRSKRAVLLLNLCVALIIANVVLLVEYGIQDHSQPSCTTLAILLHFFFLAVFFAMLVISFHLFFSVFFVFFIFTKKNITMLVVFSWICPLVIVVVSMGVTRLEGYGIEKNCWLSVEAGLIWAFVGPVIFILLLNMGVVISVLVKICGIKNPNVTIEKRNKFRSSVRNIFILNPILGLTWTFGILSANNEMIAFAYIFTLLNSFQGLFIFLLYALFHKSNKTSIVKNLNGIKRNTMRPQREKEPSSSDNSTNTGFTNNYDQTTNYNSSADELSEHEYIRIANTRYISSIKDT